MDVETQTISLLLRVVANKRGIVWVLLSSGDLRPIGDLVVLSGEGDHLFGGSQSLVFVMKGH